MTDAPHVAPFHGRLRDASGQIFWLGLALALVGIAAIVFPFASTLVATLLAGWTLLFAGLLLFIGAFSIHGTGPFFGALVTGLLFIAGGAFIVFNPLAGAVALTLILGFMFMVQGAFEIVFAFELRPHAGWWGMLLSGLASAILAIIIMAGWPTISTIALGVILGVNFLSTGFGYMLVSRAVRST
ncbi:MAG TPA: DUF308 domain-containing protein [Rhizomicrobium sp.]|nr:DUF308 domain-containing protein [Rhizomicrobium sp.]